MNAHHEWIGKKLEGQVHDISIQGMGIVRDEVSRCVFFVPGAWLEEKIIFRVASMTSRYGIGELMEVVSPAKGRRSPPCPYQGFGEGNCGGCDWMGLTYESQLQAKQHMVQAQLTRFKIDCVALPIVGAAKEWGYRNRAQIKTDGGKLGFVSKQSRSIVDIEKCMTLAPNIQSKLTELRSLLPRKDWQPQNQKDWNFLDLEERGNSQPVLNKRRPFRQAHDEQNIFMQKWLSQQLADQNKNVEILELFAGSGNFTKILHQNGFGRVTAVEAVKDAAALLAGISDSVRALALDIFKDKNWPKIHKLSQNSEVLVLDPPREGFPQLSEFAAGLPNLNRMIYISCDVQSFIQNIRPMVASGWRIRELQPIDLFPQTPHIEILAHLARASA